MALRGRFRVKSTLVAGSLCSLLLLGCPTPSKFKQPARPDGKYLVHVVSAQGETLAQISEWYADGAKTQRAIAAANGGRDLSDLKLGDRVLIPFSVVKKLEPLGPGLPRPEKSDEAADLPPADEGAAAGGALDDDFVDLPEGSATPAAATATPAGASAKRPSPPDRPVAPKPQSRPETQQPKRALDPLEELAASAEKAQRSQPAGVPVGVQPQAIDHETFDEAPGAASQPEPPQQPAAPTEAERAADGDVEELRRELGLTQ